MASSQNTMGAREYLKSLQDRMRMGEEERHLHKFNAEKWARYRARQFGVPEERALAILQESNPLQSAIDYVFSTLCSRLPTPVAQSVKNTVVGVLPLRSVNAQCLRAPSGEPLVIVDQGIMTMLHFFLESTVTSEHLTHSPDTARSGALVRMLTYWFVVKYFNRGGKLSFPGPWPGSVDYAAAYAQTGVYASEQFVVAHELAHLWAGHLGETLLHSALPESENDPVVEFYQRSREQEAEADHLAWDWYRCSLADDPVLAKFGDDALVPPLYLFQMIALLEKNRDRPAAYATHPPAEQRLRVALDCIPKGSSIRSVVEEMLKRCRNFFPDFRKFSRDEIEELDRLLSALGDAP